jgi:WD40 repeat protein
MKFEISKIASYQGHKDSVYDIAEGILENQFFSASGDGYVVEWKDPTMGIPLVKVNNPIYAIEHLKEKNRLWVGENSQGIHLIDTLNKKEEGFYKLGKTSIFNIKTFENKTFIGDSFGYIHVFDLEKLAFVHRIKGSEKSARTLAFNEQTRELAVGFSDHKFRIYDVDTYQLRYTIDAHKNSIFTLVYYQNFLISSGRDAHIKLWDATLGYLPVIDIPAHNYAINHLTLIKNGTLLASCSMDKAIKIWNLENMELLKVIDKGKFASHGTSINKLWWDAKNNRLFSASDDRTISEWKLF